MTNNDMELIKRLKNTIGCEYISDLNYEPYCTKAKEVLKNMALDNYSFFELSDIAYYIYRKLNFESKEEIIEFLKEGQ